MDEVQPGKEKPKPTEKGEEFITKEGIGEIFNEAQRLPVNYHRVDPNNPRRPSVIVEDHKGDR